MCHFPPPPFFLLSPRPTHDRSHTQKQQHVHDQRANPINTRQNALTGPVHGQSPHTCSSSLGFHRLHEIPSAKISTPAMIDVTKFFPRQFHQKIFPGDLIIDQESSATEPPLSRFPGSFFLYNFLVRDPGNTWYCG